MIRKTFYTLPVLFLMLVLVAGCSKNDADADVNTGQEDVTGSWSVTGIQSDRAYDWDGNGSTETDIFGTYSVCNRNIVYVFETGGTGRVSEGCTAPFVNISWQLSGRRLTVQGVPSGDINLDLIPSNAGTLKGTDDINVNGTSYRVTYTFTKRVRG